jgi:hypothetical protein
VSFASRLIHRLTITAVTYSTDPSLDDEFGQPSPSTSIVDVRGLVQPKTAQEMADSRSAGTEVGDFTVFLAPMDLASDASITYSGDRYAIRGIRSFDFGTSPHLEVDAQRVGPIAMGS